MNGNNSIHYYPIMFKLDQFDPIAFVDCMNKFEHSLNF